MQHNYLNVNFISCANKEEITKDASSIVVITSEQQAIHYNFQKSLSQNINSAFLACKTELIIELSHQKNFIAVVPNKEAEELRLVGALVYAALQKGFSKILMELSLNSILEKYQPHHFR